MDLPIELLVMIANASESSSLPNLRLACRELHDVTIDAFGTAFLSTLHLVISTFKPNTLLEITEHPVFGRYVKGIALVFGFPQGPHSDIYQIIDCLSGFSRVRSSIMSKAFQNIQKNHGSVELKFYDRPDGVTHTWIYNYLADVFLVVTRMVERSHCTLGQILIARKDWQDGCPDGTVRIIAKIDGWEEDQTDSSREWVR